MTVQTLALAVITVVYFLIRYFNRTDTPKIKGLPEIPGVPIFGNLLQLGDQHATVAGKWAKKFGPVFQVRMGNKVGASLSMRGARLIRALAYCLRQQLRLGSPAVDQGPVGVGLSSHFPHLPQRRIQLAGLYHWYFSMG
jgi:hypothetical protein